MWSREMNSFIKSEYLFLKSRFLSNRRSNDLNLLSARVRLSSKCISSLNGNLTTNLLLITFVVDWKKFSQLFSLSVKTDFWGTFSVSQNLRGGCHQSRDGNEKLPQLCHHVSPGQSIRMLFFAKKSRRNFLTLIFYYFFKYISTKYHVDWLGMSKIRISQLIAFKNFRELQGFAGYASGKLLQYIRGNSNFFWNWFQYDVSKACFDIVRLSTKTTEIQVFLCCIQIQSPSQSLRDETQLRATI